MSLNPAQLEMIKTFVTAARMRKKIPPRFGFEVEEVLDALHVCGYSVIPTGWIDELHRTINKMAREIKHNGSK